MARAQPSDAKIGRLIRAMQEHFAVSVDDVGDILRVKPRQAWFYIDKLRSDGVIYLRYREDNRKFYSLRIKDEVRATNRSTGQGSY